jgi:hypothetical protein
MDLRDIGWGGMNEIQLARNRDQRMTFVNTVKKLQVP